MEHERIIEKRVSSGSAPAVTYAWVAGILVMVIASLLGIMVQSAFSAQAQQQSQINQNTQNISTMQAEYEKETALLVVVAEKVGVPPTEVNQLLGAQISTN